MKQWIACSLLLVGALAVCPAITRGAEVTLSDSLNSAYVWRGQVLNDEAVWQPALYVSAGGWTIGAWANWNLTDRQGDDRENQFDEADFQLAYGKTTKGYVWEIGLWEYLFPHQVTEESAEEEGGTPTVRAAAGTREVYAKLGYEMALSPTLTVSYDFDEVNGWYGNLALSHSFELEKEKWAAELGLSLGAADEKYNDHYFGVDEAAMNDLNATAALVYSLKGWTVKGYVQYTKLMDEKIEDAATAEDSGYFNNSDNYVFGVTADFTF